MALYAVVEPNGQANQIHGSEEFVKERYTEYKIIKSDAELALEWRDSELMRTDILAILPDHPNKEEILRYRQQLRDWPTKASFPKTQPVLGV